MTTTAWDLPEIDSYLYADEGQAVQVLEVNLQAGEVDVDFTTGSWTVDFIARRLTDGDTITETGLTFTTPATGTVRKLMSAANLAAGSAGTYLVSWVAREAGGGTADVYPSPRYDLLTIRGADLSQVRTWSYTPGAATARNRVRLLIPDVTVVQPRDALFCDQELDDLLIIEGGVPELAAALALELAARNAALVMKVMRTQDVDTDGAALARELRLQAKAIRDRYRDRNSEDADATEGAFSIAPIVVGQFADRAQRHGRSGFDY